MLDLSNNQLPSVDNLQNCSALRYLNVAFNNIRALDNLHSRVGQLTTLVLRNNRIADLAPLGKLFALEKLDVAFNLVAAIDQVAHLRNLPCLEALQLTGNPIAFIFGYRVSVIALLRSAVRGRWSQRGACREEIKSRPRFVLDDAEVGAKEVGEGPREKSGVQKLQADQKQPEQVAARPSVRAKSKPKAKNKRRVVTIIEAASENEEDQHPKISAVEEDEPVVTAPRVRVLCILNLETFVCRSPILSAREPKRRMLLQLLMLHWRRCWSRLNCCRTCARLTFPALTCCCAPLSSVSLAVSM